MYSFRPLSFTPVFSLLLLLFLNGNIHAQNSNPVTINRSNVEQIAVDPLGNLYIIQDNCIEKFSLDGTFLYSFRNFSYGSIGSVVVSNPQKIMVFYPQSGIIIFLDERLSPLTDAIELHDLQYNTISMATYSTSNQIYLYDNANEELLLLDFNLNLINKIHYTFSQFAPDYMISVNEKLLLIHNPETGFYLFDAFGTFDRTLALSTDKMVQITPPIIFYLFNNQYHAYNLITMEDTTIPLPIENPKQIITFRNHYICLTANKKVIIY